MNVNQFTQQRQGDIMEESSSARDENASSRVVLGVVTRPSRAISIKRKSSCSNDCHEITDRANYEMATWRMYNRILNHRIMRQGSDGSSSSSEDEATIVCEEYMPPKRVPHLHFPGGLPPTLPRKGPDLRRWASITIDGDEEGIFQLDL